MQGLGAPLLMYLAAAGIGTLGVVDDDAVDLSNLQRQVIHTTKRIGDPKVDSAGETVTGINPDVSFVPHHTRLTSENVDELIGAYDIVADGSDNFETRFLVNDACHLAGKTLVSAAILRFEGQIATFRSGLGAGTLLPLSVSRAARTRAGAQLRRRGRPGRAGRDGGIASGGRGVEGSYADRRNVGRLSADLRRAVSGCA